MKRIGLNLIGLFAIACILFTSCEKEEYPYPSEEYGATPPEFGDGIHIHRQGVWLVTDAVMFVENNVTGAKTVYQHFSKTKSRSSMRIGGSIFDIEEIIKDTTTYTFYNPVSYPGNGRFVLNGDTTKHYMVNYMGLYSTIIEDPVYGVNEQMMGGSSRPFVGRILNLADSTIYLKIQEMDGSLNGESISYFTQLTMKKIQTF